MKTHNKMKFLSIVGIICMAIFCLPQNSAAQHFGHGGGGGGRAGGGGGGRPAGGGGFGGGARSINGGSRNFGAHVYHAPARGGGDRQFFGGGVRNEGVYHHAYGFHPYFYHPFHPYVWGPYWHPFGYFASVLTADAIMFSWAGQQYYYDDGVYYEPYNGGYTVVNPPVGAVVSYLPSGYETVPVGDAVYYYYGGTFYVSQGGSFRVVPAPEGAIVTEVPDGATDQNINGQDYLLYNNTYYQPISQNGQDAYEVVTVN